MDSTSIPGLNKSDPASINAADTMAGPPPVTSVTQPSAAATDAPEKKVEEIIPASTGDQSVAPPLCSLQAKPHVKRIESLKRDRDESSAEGVGLVIRTRREDEQHLLISVDEDPDEKTATTDVRDPNWRWPAYDEVYDPSGNLKFSKRGKARKRGTKGFPFQVIYRNPRDVVLWPDAVLIKLKSPHLMAILSKYLPDEKDLQYLEKLDLDGRRVYAILENLKKHQFINSGDEKPSTTLAGLVPSEKGSFSENDQSLVPNGVSNGNTTLATESSETQSKDLIPLEEKNHGAGETMAGARLHLHHLVRFLEEEYSAVAVRKQHMKEDKSVAFDMLWAFLTPGTMVVYKCNHTQEQLCAKVLDNSYLQTQCGKAFSVTLAVWDYNGVVYRQCTLVRMIGAFSGEEPFDILGVRPIDMDRTTSAEALKEEFTARGRRFQQLAMRSTNCFMHYNGASMRISRNNIIKEKADGRVMIDLRSFAVMNPSYPMNTAQPPVSSGANDNERNNASCAFPSRARMQLVANRKQLRAPPPHPADDLTFVVKPSKEVEEANLIFAPAIVYGFSFTLKQWSAFSVTGFSEIDFDTNAFDALVMEPELKGLMYSLVSQFIATPTVSSGVPSSSVDGDLPRVDPITNKGEGCIFLCYGPPGTGKTLTAESLAENLHRPLWSLSVSELGTTPGELEKTLLRILEIAAMWKAVLLLDEADVYLEKRVVSGDLMRNAMTGVFMRLLEYYRGVLFLTTNRITTFDDAFRSRISLVLCYPKLNKERRMQIWRTSLARVQAGKEEEVKVGVEFLADMARHKMNGREIRNAIRTAQTLARSKNEELQEQHVRFVMSIITKTSEILDATLRVV